MGRRVDSAKGKAAAKPPRARKSPKDDGAKVRDLEKRLAEALERLQTSDRERAEAREQQAAAAEILRVISSSPADVQPVFDTVITSAISLARGDYGGISLLRDDMLHLAASSGLPDAFQRVYPLRPSGLMSAALTTRAPVYTANVFDDPRVGPFAHKMASAAGYRAFIHVPLVRHDDAVIGLLTVVKREAGPFAANEIALLQTFADQAVIAIENVRLFKELAARNIEVEDKSRQLEAASRHKSDFLANMSHELRTPLNAIIGFSEVLTEHMFGDLNEKQDEYLRDIYASGQHLLSLINDILDLSKELSSEVVDERERRRTLLGEVEQSTPKPRWQPGERYATHVEGYHHAGGGAGR
jgi:GAF domain-containing protein